MANINDLRVCMRALACVCVCLNRLKIRGHNLVWSIDEFVPDYIKGQTGEELKATVRNHIQWTCNLTRGL